MGREIHSRKGASQQEERFPVKIETELDSEKGSSKYLKFKTTKLSIHELEYQKIVHIGKFCTYELTS